MSKLLLGNWLMVICSIFYLAWWIITFRPPEPKGNIIGTICLIMAFASGLGGLFLTISEMVLPTAELKNKGISGLVLLAGGAVLYILLLAMTKVLFHRQVTSELFIITDWVILEVAICNYMYIKGVFSGKEEAALSAVILIAGIVSLICYILYYELPYVKGYIDGCIPLVLVMIVMVIVNIKISRG